MNTDEAKKILSFYRPGTADASDPAFLEALEWVRRSPENARRLAERDPELGKWFAEHCASYTGAREKLRAIPVPAGLKEQILAERQVIRLPVPRRGAPLPRPLLALAAAIALVACVLPWALLHHRGPDELTACRNQMVRVALSPYLMDLETTNQESIRAFLAQHNAPANYTVPARLARAELVGCGVKSWENAAVSMICFRSGRPLRAGESTDLWLFIIDSKTLDGARPPAPPEFAQVSRAVTALWSRDDRTYILVTDKDRALLEQYL